MHITMETGLCFSTDFRNSGPRYKDLQWLHHRCYMGEN